MEERMAAAARLRPPSKEDGERLLTEDVGGGRTGEKEQSISNQAKRDHGRRGGGGGRTLTHTPADGGREGREEMNARGGGGL